MNIPQEEYEIIKIHHKKTGKIYEAKVDNGSPALNKKWFMSGVYPATYLKDEKRTIKMHRFVMDAPDGKVVDHINMDVFDNRKSNLRLCSIAENTRNRKVRKDSKSGYKGIYYRNDHKSYIAYLVINRKRIVLGERNTLEKAIDVYNNGVKKYHKDFARLNYA